MHGIKALTELTGHPFVELVSRGNAAIFYALFIAKKAGKTKVYIPDQGGWFTFKTYPKILGMNVEMIPTDNGIINHIPVADNAVLLYSQPAGYFAEQDMKSIYQQCEGKTMVIADVSGSIGSEMCDGRYADILVGSFSEWKPINIGYGGFFSVKEKNMIDSGKELFSTNKIHNSLEEELLKKLAILTKKYILFQETVNKVKKDLSSFDIIHRNKEGINVVVAYQSEKEKKELITYCTEQNLQYTVCPRYIRVNKPAISIEIKRL